MSQGMDLGFKLVEISLFSQGHRSELAYTSQGCGSTSFCKSFGSSV